jgi:hypothetical protein
LLQLFVQIHCSSKTPGKKVHSICIYPFTWNFSYQKAQKSIHNHQKNICFSADARHVTLWCYDQIIIFNKESSVSTNWPVEWTDSCLDAWDSNPGSRRFWSFLFIMTSRTVLGSSKAFYPVSTKNFCQEQSSLTAKLTTQLHLVLR